MKYLLIVLIILLGFLTIQFILINFNSVDLIDYIQPHAIINESTINGGGRGIFATKDYMKGETIEICPCVKTESELMKGRFKDYIFRFDSTMSLVALGYCSVYNHSDDFNARWNVIDEYKIKIIAERDIITGDEIFISYGPFYWTTRAHLKKK